MQILSHRGYWKDLPEKNQSVAFERSVALGFGTETDFRDASGQLVVSHDPAGPDALPIETLISTFRDTGLPLAVNVKADGLASMIRDVLDGAGIDWFVFDMSAPETFRYLKLGLPTYTRHSDIEPHPICYDECIGVWLDAFAGPEWYDAGVVRAHLEAGKKVCVVSSELHGRDPAALWGMLKEADLHEHPGLALCTDIPEDAQAFFSTGDA